MPTTPRTITGLLPDYLESLKEHTVEGQRQSLWTQFLTGVQDQYSTLSQQAQDVASYDISDAYANYKKQQLQLKMNEKLGTGFVEDLSSQLQTEYEKTYQDIRNQEAETLGKIASEQAKAIETGEKELTSYAKKLRAWDELIVEYGKTLEGERFKIPDNFRDSEGNLTEEGKLWYYDVLEYTSTSGQHFYDWVLGEDTSNKYNLEEREAAYLAYKENPELFTQLTSGLDASFDVAAARKHQQERFNNLAMASEVALKDNNLKSANSGTGDNFKVTYKDKSYKVEKGASPDSATQGTLTSTYKDRYGVNEIPEGTIVVYRGQLYIYIENNDSNKVEWSQIQARKRDSEDMDALMKALGLGRASWSSGSNDNKSGEVRPLFPRS